MHSKAMHSQAMHSPSQWTAALTTTTQGKVEKYNAIQHRTKHQPIEYGITSELQELWAYDLAQSNN